MQSGPTTLNECRNTGRRIDLDSASALLRQMHAAPGGADSAEVQTCCLLLLGQWVNGELYRPLSKPLALRAITNSAHHPTGAVFVSTKLSAYL